MADPEIHLFRRMQEGDRLALSTLFEMYYQRLCSFSNTYLRHSPDAEECVADVFANLWRCKNQLRIDQNLKSYLFVSVRNASLAVLRKKTPSYEKLENFAELLSETYGPEQVLLYRELEEITQQAIDELPTRCREVYTLIRIEGFTYKEASKVLAISENTVENHLLKALNSLRNAIRQYRQQNSGRNTNLTY